MPTLKPVILAIAAAAALAPVYAQSGESKTAEQVFKNIVALKGIPADQLVPTMQFMSAALGVECNTCHVQGKPEADDKGAKKTARAMIEMTLAINKANFNGRVQVSCYSCHRGSERPVAVPPVLESDMPARPEARPATPPAQTPPATADSIAAKYLEAAGGADAIAKITTRVGKGEILVGSNKMPIDLITKAPDKRITITHSGNGESFTAFDGKIGWLGNTGRPAREMSAAEAGSAAVDAQFALPAHLKEVFPQLRRGRPEQVNGEMCDVLNGSGPGRPPVRLYFDQKTGLLVRLLRFTDTPVGRNPVEIDYADYRDVDGVKVPFRWTLARTNGRFTIQLSEMKANVPVDDSRFAKPEGEVK